MNKEQEAREDYLVEGVQRATLDMVLGLIGLLEDAVDQSQSLRETMPLADVKVWLHTAIDNLKDEIMEAYPKRRNVN